LLERLAYVHGLLAVLAIVLAVTAALFRSKPCSAGVVNGAKLAWSLGCAALGTGAIAWYFHLRTGIFAGDFRGAAAGAFRLVSVRISSSTP